MVIQIDRSFAAIIDAVAQEIISTEHFGAGSIIKTPLTYPTGAGVVVEITQHQDRFFVTDMGRGFIESDSYAGIGSLYNRVATEMAAHAGIRFDNQAFFVAEASRDQLGGATTIIANCSAQSAMQAAMKANERRYAEDSDEIYMRLKQVFLPHEIDRNVDVVGASSHKWPVSNLVKHNGILSIFDPVRKHHNSVVNAVAKFHDIARLEMAPKRFAVVKNLEDFGDFANMLAQASRVVSLRETPQQLKKLAEAA